VRFKPRRGSGWHQTPLTCPCRLQARGGRRRRHAGPVTWLAEPSVGARPVASACWAKGASWAIYSAGQRGRRGGSRPSGQNREEGIPFLFIFPF
jgi:hypothetical protein